MSKINAVLRNTGLFEGVADTEIDAMLRCLGATRVKYGKGEYVSRRGEDLESIMIVLDGKVQLVKDDYWGNRTVLMEYKHGDTMGTEYACAEGERMDVSLVTAEHSEILFLEVRKVATTCPSSCSFHSRVIMNLLRVLAKGSLDLNGRLDRMSKRSTRDKIRAFLSDNARMAGSNEFFITMNRQEMADHLGVDRSAMSAELGRMKKDGIIDFDRNHFILR